MLAAVVGFQESTSVASAVGKMKAAIAGVVKGVSRRGKDGPDTQPAYETADTPSDESAAEDDSSAGSAEEGDTEAEPLEEGDSGAAGEASDVYEVDGGADEGSGGEADGEADGGETDPDFPDKSDKSDESDQTESQP
jgi:hypothetical protein